MELFPVDDVLVVEVILMHVLIDGIIGTGTTKIKALFRLPCIKKKSLPTSNCGLRFSDWPPSGLAFLEFRKPFIDSVP